MHCFREVTVMLKWVMKKIPVNKATLILLVISIDAIFPMVLLW